MKAHRKLCKDAQHLYNIAITFWWSHDGGIQIDRFPEETKTQLAWVGDRSYEFRSARTGAF